MNIKGAAQELRPGAVIELFTLDLSRFGAPVVRFHAGTNKLESDVVWQGQTYQRYPVQATGFEMKSQGTLPRPQLVVSNVTGIISAMCRLYHDLVGARVIRKRTLARYLDAVNFPLVHQVAVNQRFGTPNGMANSFQLIGPDGHAVTQDVSVDSVYREDWQGLMLLRPFPRTNLIRYSEDFTQSVWSKYGSSITANAVVGPDGRMNGAKFVEGTNTGEHYMDQNPVPADTTQPYTRTVYVKGGERHVVTIRVFCSNNSGSHTHIFFNTETGTFSFPIFQNGTATYRAERVDNGWWKIEFTCQFATVDTGLRIRTQLVSGASSTSYAGDGVSGAYIQYQMLESGEDAGSYIPTTNAAVTLTDYHATDAGIVTLAQAPAASAALTWNGSGNSFEHLTADPNEHFPDEIFFVNCKTREDREVVEFELATAFDVEGVQLPRRQVIRNSCPWRYRGDGCGYAGGPVADANDNPTSDWNADVCGKRLSSCKLRFGAHGWIPIGAFPGASAYR